MGDEFNLQDLWQRFLISFGGANGSPIDPGNTVLNPEPLGVSNNLNATGVPTNQQQQGGIFGNLLGGQVDQQTGQRAASPLLNAVGVGSALLNSWTGMQQLDLAKDQFNFQKQAFNKNFENQRKLTNTALADRQSVRYSADPSRYQSVGDYLKERGV